MTFTASPEESVPVLIVGGGGAWRAPTACSDPLAELAGAFSQILASDHAKRVMTAHLVGAETAAND